MVPSSSQKRTAHHPKNLYRYSKAFFSLIAIENLALPFALPQNSWSTRYSGEPCPSEVNKKPFLMSYCLMTGHSYCHDFAIRNHMPGCTVLFGDCLCGALRSQKKRSATPWVLGTALDMSFWVMASIDVLGFLLAAGGLLTTSRPAVYLSNLILSLHPSQGIDFF